MHRSSKTFSREDELVAVLRAGLLSVLRKGREGAKVPRRSTLILEQMPVGMIIPDLLVIERPSRKRATGTGSGISYLESAIVAQLFQRGPQTSESISEALYSRPSTVVPALSRLEKAGAVQKRGTGEFDIIQDTLPLDTLVTSIEAKLQDWREAVQQAKAYGRFSNYSYIALPRAIANESEEARSTCLAEGVGLISVSSRRLEIIVKPQMNKPFSPEWVWVLSKVVGIQNPARHSKPAAKSVRRLEPKLLDA
jgi:predicted transcriptional regulator